MKKEESNTRIFCNWCQQITNHILKANHFSRVDYFDYSTGGPIDEKESFDPAVDSFVEYRLWYCRGCDSGTLEIYCNEEPLAPTSDFFPPRELNRVFKKEFISLPLHLKSIYFEIISCYHNSLNLSCAIGLRALIEGICADKNINGRNLKEKIVNLKDILPEHIVNELHSFRYLGNKAVHELDPSNQFELKIHIDVLESLLGFLYDLERKTNRLRRRN